MDPSDVNESDKMHTITVSNIIFEHRTFPGPFNIHIFNSVKEEIKKIFHALQLQGDSDHYELVIENSSGTTVLDGEQEVEFYEDDLTSITKIRLRRKQNLPQGDADIEQNLHRVGGGH